MASIFQRKKGGAWWIKYYVDGRQIYYSLGTKDARVRPILGTKMDEVFAAYHAEDPDGKQQLENYLELLSAKHLPQGLDDSEPGLIPPSREQAQGQYPIGQISYPGKSLYPFGLRENEWIQHMAILGRSGSGKTNIGFSILQTLIQHCKPFLVFDWKRNYRDLFARPEFHDVEVYTIGRNTAPLMFNPLIPPAGTDPKTRLKKLNEVIAHAYCLGNGVLFLLQQAVDAVYEEAGVYENLVARWPGSRSRGGVITPVSSMLPWLRPDPAKDL